MKKLITLSLFLVLIGIISGCNTEKEVEKPKYESTESFLFGNWGTPPQANTGYEYYSNNPNYCTVENYQKMVDCGYNYCVHTGSMDYEKIIFDLDVASNVDIKLLVGDSVITGIINLGGTYDETKESIKKNEKTIIEHITEYSKYKAFAGVNAKDEPSADYYPAIAAMQDWFYKNYPEYEFYVNLLPEYASNKQLFGSQSGTGKDYYDYVADFVYEVNPTCLSYDHYPYCRDSLGNPYIMESFLYNLNVFALEGKESGIPTRLYVQTMGFYENLPITEYREFAWQCYTSLAFGVRGILTFQYWTQLQEEYLNNVRGGSVERDGTINEPNYYSVQEVFSEIKAMEHVYMNFTWDGVKTYLGGRIINGSFKLISDQLENLYNIQDVETNEDLIIGQFFDLDGNPGYMVTNASDFIEPKTATVTLTFDKDTDYIYLLKKGKEFVKALDKNHSITLDIGSGEGNFIVPIK